jgi:hypothetical protein
MEYVILIVVVLVIAIIIAAIQTSNQTQAEKSANEKIATLGIQQSIIKQSPTRIRHSDFSPPQGLLVLSWDQLLFFGVQHDLELPLRDIRSTSCEGSNLVVIDAEGETYRFQWDDVKTPVHGVGATTGGNLGAGMGLSTSHSPIPREWQQLIDDVRFGKIHKPV